MNLKKLQKNWNLLGKKDPMWAILVSDDKRNNKWKTEEFFKSGIMEVEDLLSQISNVGINISKRHAFDFGCGIGRLTQALGNHFEKVKGVDIAESMIKQAKLYNKHGSRCEYILNTSNELVFFPSNLFDLIYSNITLQHIAPKYSMNYIREFIRVLHPEGILVFQIPSEYIPENDNNKFRNRIRKLLPKAALRLIRKIIYLGEPEMEMHCIAKDNVIKLLNESNAKAIHIEPFLSAGDRWNSYRYFVCKNELTELHK